jgi:hypothetical protein
MSDTPAEKLALEIMEVVLSDLGERRPFKHDLGDMETGNPLEWKRMMKSWKEGITLLIRREKLR